MSAYMAEMETTVAGQQLAAGSESGGRDAGARTPHAQARAVTLGAQDEGSRGLTTTSDHGTPPPPVVLGAEVQVAHDDGDLNARDQQDAKHNRQEPKDIVKPVLPDRGQDEKHFDEHSAKGEKPARDG
jgi:hypothetical protein